MYQLRQCVAIQTFQWSETGRPISRGALNLLSLRPDPLILLTALKQPHHVGEKQQKRLVAYIYGGILYQSPPNLFVFMQSAKLNSWYSWHSWRFISALLKVWSWQRTANPRQAVSTKNMSLLTGCALATLITETRIKW